MDRAKTLTQLPGNKYGKDMVDALRMVCKQEGTLPGLYRGLPVAMVRESSKNMFCIGLFAPILSAMHRDTDTSAAAWKPFLACTVTGALGGGANGFVEEISQRLVRRECLVKLGLLRRRDVDRFSSEMRFDERFNVFR